MIAARGSNQGLDAGGGFFEPGAIDEGAAKLEGAEWRMIFMFEPDLDGVALGSESLVDERPTILWRWGHGSVNDGLSSFDFLESGQLHIFSLR